MLRLDYDPANVSNLAKIIGLQQDKMARLRGQVKGLQFVPIDPAGSYAPVSFKSFDGGVFNLHFDPFEFDVVEVADSDGNVRLKFAAPGGDLRDSGELPAIIADLDADPTIRRFLDILGEDSLEDITEILTNRGTLMEIGELACTFAKVDDAPADGTTVVIYDGLLRTKKLKAELIPKLSELLRKNKGHVKVAGVAKSSKVLFMLKAALVCEKIFPADQVGYVKIPLDIEEEAYRWSGHGRIARGQGRHLDYAFGGLYIAKLSRAAGVLVTVEIPEYPVSDTCGPVYSEDEAGDVMSFLAKDSLHSYPVPGYPQTVMRAHENAVSLGIPSSILRDRIMGELTRGADPVLAAYVRDEKMLGEGIEKGSLGGGRL